MKKIIKVANKDKGLRLDKWLKKNFSSLNQSFIEKNIRKKNIQVNNLKKVASYRLLDRDKVTILNYDEVNYKNLSSNKKYTIEKIFKELFKNSIIFESRNFIILDKWSGIATQGGSKIKTSIDHIIKNISSSYNLVHRLDKETSGLLIIAKNLKYTKLFGQMFKSHQIKKKYLAICQGRPKISESIMELNIPRKENTNLMHKTETYYKVLDYKNNLSQILFIPKTGRTHQLRIVSKKLGCPIVGDKKYNFQNKFKVEKLKLNAYEISFEIKGKNYIFSSLIPFDFKKFLQKNNLNIYK